MDLKNIDVLEKDLQIEFKKETGKNAIWRGKPTNAYEKWKANRQQTSIENLKKKTQQEQDSNPTENISLDSFLDFIKKTPIKQVNHWDNLNLKEPKELEELNKSFTEIPEEIAWKIFISHELYGFDEKGNKHLIKNKEELSKLKTFAILKEKEEITESESSEVSDKQIELIAKEVFKED